MKKILFFLLIAGVFLSACNTQKKTGPGPNEKWTSIHLLDYTTDSALAVLGSRLPALAKSGINVLFLEVDYNFDFKSHPELRDSLYITKEAAQKFAQACREANIRLIPQFQSLGHQSRGKVTLPLLTVYPELDVTPGEFPNNEGIYCREWDPTNPKVNEIVFPLIDEIVEAFEVDGIHLGMDEVFLLGSEKSPTTKGKNTGELFAKVVNEFHDYFAKKKGLEIFMWADRLIDGTKYSYGEWESSLNGTAVAIDMIPKDVVMCDWHYEPADEYGSVAMFLEKGFRVLPCSWRKVSGVEALIKYSYKLNNPNMLGHMFTTWYPVPIDTLMGYRPMIAGIDLIKSKKFYDVTIKSQLQNDAINITLNCGNDSLQVTYTLDGSEPTAQSQAYKEPFALKETALLRALAFRGNAPAGTTTERQFNIHYATGKPVQLLSEASSKYKAIGGADALVNGTNGSGSYADGQWLAFEGNDMEVAFDLGVSQNISSVVLHSNNNPWNSVYPAQRVEVYVSADGKSYKKAGESVTDEGQTKNQNIVTSSVSFKAMPARFVKVKAFHKTFPANASNADNKAWLFVDEVIVQ